MQLSAKALNRAVMRFLPPPLRPIYKVLSDLLGLYLALQSLFALAAKIPIVQQIGSAIASVLPNWSDGITHGISSVFSIWLQWWDGITRTLSASFVSRSNLADIPNISIDIIIVIAVLFFFGRSALKAAEVEREGEAYEALSYRAKAEIGQVNSLLERNELLIAQLEAANVEDERLEAAKVQRDKLRALLDGFAARVIVNDQKFEAKLRRRRIEFGVIVICSAVLLILAGLSAILF